MTDRIRVSYATQSAFKRAELAAFLETATFGDGQLIGARFDLAVSDIDVKEVLEVDLVAMVTAEVQDAYRQLREPCIVEHAGLVFDHRREKSYPGGLTKPMWNALGDAFIEETQSAGIPAIARAVIGYCDGREVKCFVGETHGVMADTVGDTDQFYWDTAFKPDVEDETISGLTYAEIVAHPDYGLAYKVEHLSQSFRALRTFLDYRSLHEPQLWQSRYGT